MRKILDSKFLFILALSLIVLIILGIGAFYLFDDTTSVFVADGYVLNPASAKVQKYFFSENTGYRENLSQMIEFTDIDKNDATVFKESFLHYMDGSMSFLKNGAILDLDSIQGKKTANFYNITSSSIIKRSGNGYIVENSGGDIKLGNFIGRISDDKFIVVGSLEAKIPGNSANVQGDYFEIVYTDEGVINIENKDVKYQVTADGTLIYAGDIVIDLGDKKITKAGEDVMSITAVTVNGNENIEIIPKPSDDKKNGNEDEDGDGNNNQTTPTTPTENGEGAGGGGGNGEGENNSPDIIISLEDAYVGSTNVNVSFDIENQRADDVFTLKVTNLDSGRTVDVVENVLPDQDIRVNLLSPNTKYLFTVVNERDSGKYFQKIFETTDFGISLEKSYATSDTLAYKITVGEDTDITNAKLSLYKFNEETKQNEIVETSYYDAVTGEVKTIAKVTNLASLGEISGTKEIVYDGLDSNTIYTAVLDEFSVVSSNFKDIYNINLTSLTLKKSPTFADMTVNKDVGKSSFSLSLSDIVDPDNAITNYTYLIYDVDDSTKTAIDPITKSNASAIEVKIGDGNNQLKSDTNYFYKVVIEYFDNEKSIEYVTTDSINFIMGTEPYITVIPVAEKISYDTIGATIYLIDNSCLISVPGRTKCDGDSTTIVDVSKINAITGERTSVFTKTVDFQVLENEVKYDLFLDNLQANTTYTIELRAVRNDLSGNEHVEILHTDESKKSITTKTLSSFVATWDDAGSSANHVINVDSKFVGIDDSGTMLPADSAASIKKIVAKLYMGDYVEDLQLRQPIATAVLNNSDEFNIKENFYDNAYTITSDGLFGLDIDALRDLDENGKLSEYYTIALYAYYDSEGVNEVRLNNNVMAYRISPVLLMDNVHEPEIDVTYITKINGNINTNLINDGTYVGYKVTAAFDRIGLLENHLSPNKINFYVYDKNGNRVNFFINDNGNLVSTDKITATLDELNYYEANIYMTYGTEYDINDQVMSRGNKYYVGYDLDLNGDNGMVKYPTNTNGKIHNNYGLYEEVNSEKETPTLKMYVAKSTANSITYRYEVQDPDNAFYKDAADESYSFYYTINGSEPDKLHIIKTDAAVKTFAGDMTINGLHNGDTYQLYYKKNVTKTDNFENDVLDYLDAEDGGGRIFDGYYDSSDSAYNFRFQVINNSETDNKVTIKILASDEMLERILSYKINFKDSKNNTFDKELWKLSPCSEEDTVNRCFFIDYVELKNAGMKSENNEINPIKVKVMALYDNGLVGYDFTVGKDKEYPYMIFQNNSTEFEVGNYISFTSRGQLTAWTDAIEMPKGYYTYNFLGNYINYKSSLNTSHSASISYVISSTGYRSSNFGILNPKMVSVSEMSTDNDTFSFSSITPKIAIRKTTRLINGAVVNMALTGADINDFCEENSNNNCVNTASGDKYVYVEVWKNAEDVGDKTRTVIPTIKVKVNNSNPALELSSVIDKLSNASAYYYQVYAYLNKNNRSVYTQLYDASYNDRYLSKTYNFQTLLSEDIFKSFSIDYESKEDGEYNDKLLDTKINLYEYNNGIEFNYDISYALCLANDDTCGVQQDDTNIFKKTVSSNNLAVTFIDKEDIATYNLEFDKDYRLYIYAVFDVYDKTTNTTSKKYLLLNRRTSSVNLRKLTSPDFVVTREASYVNGEYVIDFGINVNDVDKTLIDGEYFIKLLDANGNIVGSLQEKDNNDTYHTVASGSEYENYSFNATVVNKKIRVSGLSDNTKYTVVVYGRAFLNNYSETIPVAERTVVIEKSHTVYSTNSSGVAFGQDVLFSATEKSIIVTFLGGSNFDNVREVSYTIGLWDNDTGEATYADTYIIGDDKHFEMYKDIEDWRFVIDPDGMTNVLGQTYTVALGFKVYNPATEEFDYYDSSTNPEFAGRAQYVKDNK